MSMYEVGAKVRIQPEFCRTITGVLRERGWFVENSGDKNALLSRRDGTLWRPVPWECLAPDVDLPYDPPAEHKTLAEKELEVLQQDPVRRRWQELLGPQPEPKVKIDFFPFQTSDSVDAAGLALDYMKKVGITRVPNTTSHFKKWAKVYEDAQEIYRTVTGREPPEPEAKFLPAREREHPKFVPAENYYTQTADLEKKVAEHISRGLNIGQRVYDAYYSRAGTVRTIQSSYVEGTRYKVQWDARDGDGPMSLRERNTLRTEAEQAAENERLRTYFAEKTPGFNPTPAPRAFKAGDRVRRAGAKFQAYGTISVLTDLLIEVQWDDGGKTAGAYDPAAPATWFEHVPEVF